MVNEQNEQNDLKRDLRFSSRMIIFIKLAYLSSVISLKWQ